MATEKSPLLCPPISSLTIPLHRDSRLMPLSLVCHRLCPQSPSDGMVFAVAAAAAAAIAVASTFTRGKRRAAMEEVCVCLKMKMRYECCFFSSPSPVNPNNFLVLPILVYPLRIMFKGPNVCLSRDCPSRLSPASVFAE